MLNKVITINSEILGGTPVFEGTRVPVSNLFDYIETAETISSFLEDFPSVRIEQVIRLFEDQRPQMNLQLKALSIFCQDWCRLNTKR